MSDSILIVDDERGIRETLRGVLEDEGYAVEAVATGEDCLKALERRNFGCVLLDVWLPGIDGLETLARLKETDADCAVVMISGHGNIETAVRATKLGAFDFVEKPLSLEKITLVVRNALRQRQLERVNAELKAQTADEYEMVGASVAMRALRKQIAAVAPTDGRVLIYGESGTGKELVARAIHAQSRRAGAPVGGGTAVSVDVRVIAATNKQLDLEIERGNFRPDLFYRLNVIPFEVPPLRERLEDVPLLVEHFNRKFSEAYGKQPKRFEPDALAALQDYSWPGNVRELRNTIEREVIMHGKQRV